MAELPPISSNIYDTQIKSSATVAEEDHSSDETPESPSRLDPPAECDIMNTLESFDISSCIFCATESPSVEQNLSHMSSTHGFRIPDLDHLTDVDTFLGFLSTTVKDYHECLYCGHEKASVQGIRQHMISKGHCMINMDPGSEYLEFWDSSGSSSEEEEGGGMEESTSVSTPKQSSRPMSSSNPELRLPSGAVITPRSQNPRTAKHHSATRRANPDPIRAIDSPSASESSPISSLSLPQPRPRRNQTLTSLSPQQTRALAVTEKKSLRQHLLAQAHHRHQVEKAGNKQRHFKVRRTRCLDFVALAC